MQAFKEYYLLKETPDKMKGQVWKQPDAVCLGIMGNLGLGLQPGSHTHMYNDLYILFKTNTYSKQPQKGINSLGLKVTGDLIKNKDFILSKFREFPWALINRSSDEHHEDGEISEMLREEFFNVSGRFWIKTKQCSFWNLQSTVQSYLKPLKEIFVLYGQKIEEYEFEFIERQGKLINWWELSGQPAPEVTPQQKEESRKLMKMQHTNPVVKKQIAAKGGGANKLASFANALGFRNPIEFTHAHNLGG